MQRLLKFSFHSEGGILSETDSEFEIIFHTKFITSWLKFLAGVG